MLAGMRKILVTTAFAAAVALAAASIALAATTTTTTNLWYFQGKTAHSHYVVSITSECSVKKCTSATTAAVTVTAGSSKRPTAAGCPFAGYSLPNGHIKGGKFSVTGQYVVNNKVLKFTATGTFTGANKLSGTISGVKACGGSDSFSLKGVRPKKTPTIGPTGN